MPVARAPAVPGVRYGVAGTIGEAAEPATTTGTVATTSNYVSVLGAATPGSTVLLQAGTYGGFTIPAGTSGNPVTVKRYSTDAVTITGQVTFNSYTRLAGVKVESTTAQWLARIGSTNSTPIQDVELRNSTWRGGTTEAIRVRQNSVNVRLLGLDVEGGRDAHCVKYHYESVTTWRPGGSVVNCRFRKRNLAGGGIYDYTTTEDLLQLEGHSFVTVDRCTFGIMQASTASEEGMDIKTAGDGCLVTRCLFEGPFGGEAMICQADNDNQTISNNRFVNDSFSLGASFPDNNPTALIQRNWFDGATLQLRQSGLAPRSYGPKVWDNIFSGSGNVLKFGTSTVGDQPQNVTLKGNRLTSTNIILNNGTTYTCDGTNVFTSTTGASLSCS